MVFLVPIEPDQEMEPDPHRNGSTRGEGQLGRGWEVVVIIGKGFFSAYTRMHTPSLNQPKPIPHL